MASQGVLSVNVSAGNENAAANMRAIAVSPDGSVAAMAHGSVVQRGKVGPANGAAVASIEGPSFAGFRGVLGVNQQAGHGNVSANQLAIAQGIGGVAHTGFSALTIRAADDSLLAGSTAGVVEQLVGEIIPTQQTNIDPAAFSGGRGVFQINQVAGNGNITTNALAVQFSRPPGS
ncbi:hypothetical protein BJP62_09235 [Jeongeupia sp. USM3]|nr:hypothetical protein BJP62_09235 [Jeongeupia sp. USM3]